MAYESVERFVLDGCAFVPFNQEGVGDRLSILTVDAMQTRVNVSVDRFLEQTVRFFGSDPVALRKIYGQVIGRKQYIPLPLTPTFTLIPLKVRKPVGRQRAYGWFVAEKIRSVRKKTTISTTIYLYGNHEVTGLQSVESCEQQLRHVLLVQHHYAKLHQKPAAVREPFTYYHYL